jgi:hypothetical protein
LVKIVAEDHTVATRLIKDAGDDRDERRLATARWADKHHQFARSDLQVNATQCLDSSRAFAKGFSQGIASYG